VALRIVSRSAILLAVSTFWGVPQLTAQAPPARALTASTPLPPATTIASLSRPATAPLDKSDGARLLAAVRPSFLKNEGQFDAQVRYRLQSGNLTVWVTSTSVVFDTAQPCKSSDAQEAPEPQAAEFSPNDGKNGAPCFDRTVFAQDFQGIRKDAVIEAADQQPGVYNFLVGAGSQKGPTGVRSYSKIVYRNAWPGIDIRLIAGASGLEQEFLVRPGADPKAIRIAYRGIEGLRTADDGALIVQTPTGQIRESKPIVFQEIATGRVSVEGRFRLDGSAAYQFDVGTYDSERELLIDPTLLYSTFLGGATSPWDQKWAWASSIKVDANGNAFVTGATRASDFPTTPGMIPGSSALGYPSTYEGAFVTKINSVGSGLVYSTFLFGSEVSSSQGRDIDIDAEGNAYVVGWANAASKFPNTPGNADTSRCESGGPFFIKLSSDGSTLLSANILACSGYVASYGGADVGVAVDSARNVYIGMTAEWCGSVLGGFQSQCGGGFDLFLLKASISSSGVFGWQYSTFLGGNGVDYFRDLAVDQLGNLYVTGETYSANFPTTVEAYQRTKPVTAGMCNGSVCSAAFVAKINPANSGAASLVYSTYLGGEWGSSGRAIAVDASGSAHVGGFVNLWGASSNPFPTTPGTLQPTFPSGWVNYCGFIAVFDTSGSSLVYSTLLTGKYTASGNTFISGLAVDSAGNVLVAGSTQAGDFPVTPDAYLPTRRWPNALFVTVLNRSLSTLVYSTYLGNAEVPYGMSGGRLRIAGDSVGDAYVAGGTYAVDHPATPGAFQTRLLGTSAAFVTKFPTGSPMGLAISGVLPASGGNSGTVTLRVVGSGFHIGATAKLVCAGSEEVPGSNAMVSPGGRTLSASFNLAGRPIGTCDVAIVNPDGTTTTRNSAFSIEAGGEAKIWHDVLGRQVARPFADQTTYVIVGNKGNIDSAPTRVWVAFPSSAQLSSTGSVLPALRQTVNGTTYLALDVPTLEPGSTRVLPVGLSLGGGQGTFRLWTWRDGCQTCTPDPSVGKNGCGTIGLRVCDQYGLFCTGTVLDNPCGLPTTSFRPACDFHDACYGTRGASKEGCDMRFTSMLLSTCALAMLDPPAADTCLTAAVAYSSAVSLFGFEAFYEAQTEAANKGWGRCSVLADCTPSSFPIVVVASSDPNEKVGAIGVGPGRFIMGSASSSYAVFFENKPTATAPAQEIVVTDNIDPGKIELSTLILGPIALPGTTITPPAIALQTLGSFFAVADLRPTMNMAVRISAELTAGGVLTWRFTSIDPSTGLPPDDPLAGFLPPGAGGSVSFTAALKPGLPTGTVVKNKATIVFDTNAPMDTPEWINTLDRNAPTSRVSPLTATQATSCFKPQWTGSDVGAGLKGFTVLVSDNGGPYTPWLTNTTSTSTVFNGLAGHNYRFYSQATDLVGNVEAAKSAAEATTTVGATATCNGRPTIAGAITGKSAAGTTRTLTLQLTNTGLGAAQNVKLNQIALRTLSGTGTVTLAGPTLPVSVGALGVGAATTVTMTLNVPATVKLFSLTESGTFQDLAGATFSFSIGQSVIP